MHAIATAELSAPDVCRRLAAEIPGSLYGRDRILFLIDRLNALAPHERDELRARIEMLVRYMIEIDASDIDAGGYAGRGLVWYRAAGNKRPHEQMGRYSLDDTDILFLGALNATQHMVLTEAYSVDFSYSVRFNDHQRPRRFRATLYFENDHLGLNMRAVTDDVRKLATLDFHPLIERGLRFQHERDGLTLITGVTGSGKSSTLDAIVDANNEEVEGHIIVVAKPIEYVHDSKRCIVRHREVGRDVRSFKEGIVQALRQDPDIVVIGEMRDPETISAALEITDSGHKVFSTLHTSSAVESIDRIIGEYPANEQERVRNRLADVLRCVISQKLCPKLGGGRVLVKEVLWMTSAARAAIKNDNSGEIYQMMWEGAASGQTTLEQDLLRLARQRLISPDTAMGYANNKRRMQQLLS